MSPEKQFALVLALIMVFIVGMSFLLVEQTKKDKALCAAKGGEYVELHRAALCVPKGAVINLSDR